jgi:hypothetical protein
LQKFADSQFGGPGGTATPWAPGTWYIGLSVAAPAADGAGFVEPTGGAYARVASINNLTNWPLATIGADGIVRKQNGTKVTFVNPTAPWGTITHWGVFLALTGGLPEWWQALDSPIAPRQGNTPVEFDAGMLWMGLAGS